MDERDELMATVRQVIDSNRYLVLGTVESDGRPRVSPVYYGVDDDRDFYWVSSPDAIHSMNVEARPDVSAVIYDSSVHVGHGRAVYLTGRARRVTDGELPDRTRVAFREHMGGRAFRPEELQGAADLRLYLLTAEALDVHIAGSHPTLGTGIDRRVRVWPAA
jgi:nitroimidazol reductase NimA-like FMN-containing flavoprotein (pyridoxamine 5'-phosphate oxidase superfamily)